MPTFPSGHLSCNLRSITGPGAAVAATAVRSGHFDAHSCNIGTAQVCAGAHMATAAEAEPATRAQLLQRPTRFGSSIYLPPWCW